MPVQKTRWHKRLHPQTRRKQPRLPIRSLSCLYRTQFYNTTHPTKTNSTSTTTKKTKQPIRWRTRRNRNNNELYRWHHCKYTIWGLTLFFTEFEKQGKPLGCILNPSKCKILTSTLNQSPTHLLSQSHKNDLISALNKYCISQPQGEIIDGIRILGYPIGNPQYVQKYQLKILNKLRTTISAIHQLVPDPHIAISLFTYSLQHFTTHLTFTDIIHNQNESILLKHYSTTFTKAITNMTKTFLKKQYLTPMPNMTKTSRHMPGTYQQHQQD